MFCRVCFCEQVKETSFACQHLTSCSDCAEKLKFCPICKAPLEK